MKYPFLFLLSTLLVSCGGNHPSEPREFNEVEFQPTLYPDYTDVTIPCNIAPMNFMVLNPSVDACVARIESNAGVLTVGEGRKVQIPQKDWERAIHSTRDGSLAITLYTHADGVWRRHPTFRMEVAPDEVDPWLSYRLIEPSYVAYEDLDIMQRSLSNFEEKIIASNHVGQRKEQCINCHSYQNYHTENMLYHVRGAGGGTMLTYKGQSRLMTAMRRDGMMSNPVYPAWHPTLPLIAFSTNLTGQLFHTQSIAKVEVQDKASALVLYDVERDTMFQLPHTPERLDNFPTWAPDGRRLYYTSALYEARDSTVNTSRDMANNYQDVKYNLYYRDFDPDRLAFGEEHLLLDLQSMNQSASLPRVSPDGKSLLYASGLFGCFHVWHPDADIRLLHLDSLFAGRPDSLALDKLLPLNSSRAESYPSWSSNGRWITFISRRTDGNYSRVYMAYYDAEGQVHKPFVLPQSDPEHDRLLLRSYNRPEPMVEGVRRE
ncbi:MAG: PD40 domain-containing protein [Bacteroidales bacterium]|nr:PD40 domain-containing protein [Bacteroidales bacterium]